MNDLKHQSVVVFLAAFLSMSVGARAAPQIVNLSHRGLRIDGVTTLTITGSELSPQTKLVVDFPVAKQEVLKGASAASLQLRVTLGKDVAPGLYNLRVANESGISKSIVVAVDRLPEALFDDRIESLPAALHGSVTGSKVAGTKFAGKAGQELLVEIEAQRIGSKLRPVLHLYDARRRQVAWAMTAPWLAGDARLAAKLPADGEYTIEIHDLQYAGPAPGQFRLKVGAFHFADLTFPPAVQRGQAAKLELIGNVPAGQLVDVQAPSSRRSIAAPWPKDTSGSGPRPRVILSDLTEVVEQRKADEPQTLPSIPIAVSGRLDAADQTDVYRLNVAEGTKLRFDVFADRLGSPIDAHLEVRAGAAKTQNDDAGASPDPRLDYTVPKGVKSIDVAIRDQVGGGGARSIYRLAITKLGGVKKPSFRLKVVDDTHNVPQDATHVFRVVAERDGYNGPIRLFFDNLPPHVSVSGAGIAAGSQGALITLSAAKGAPRGIITSIRGASVGLDPPLTATAVFTSHPLAKHQPWMQEEIGLALAAPNSVPFRVDWAATNTIAQLYRGATLPASVKLTRPPGEIGPIRLSLISGEPTPIVKGKADANRAVRGEKAAVDIPVDPKAKAALDALAAARTVAAAAAAKEKTTSAASAKAIAASQAAVKSATAVQAASARAAADSAARQKSAQERMKLAIAELAAAEKKLQEANAKLAVANTALATAKQAMTAAAAKAKADNDAATAAQKAADAKSAQSEKAFRAAEANIKKDAQYRVIVPPTLGDVSQDLVLQAELRSVDNKTVLARVFTPVRRFKPRDPLALALSGGAAFVEKLDAKNGAKVKISGLIERRGGFAGDVTVSLAGQPKGVAAPKVVLKPDETQFELALMLPANTKAGEISSIKVFATGPHNPKAANVVVRAEVPIAITLLPAEPAATNKK